MDEKQTILFVDDEVRLLRSIERGLLDEPYNLLFAESGKRALKLLEENEVHVIVTDMRMPEGWRRLPFGQVLSANIVSFTASIAT